MGLAPVPTNSNGTLQRSTVVPEDDRGRPPRHPSTDAPYVRPARRVCSLTDTTNQNKNAIFRVVYCMRQKSDVTSIDPLRVGVKETRSLSSLYERRYDPPRVCLYENIGSFLAVQKLVF